MSGLDDLEILFVASSFLFQSILIVHFALRKWHFDYVMRYGWIVYGLSLPAAVVSMLLLLNGKTWSFWLGGVIYLVWAVYGFAVEYIKKIQWRNPTRLPIFGPYLFLYLAAVMFYWWPLGLISKPLWYVYAVLFIISTTLNVTSHKGQQGI